MSAILSIWPLLEWPGCALGVAGAFLLASNSRFSPVGWLLFLASNACWIVYALGGGMPGLFWQQIAFTATSLLGVWRWIVRRPTEGCDAT